MIRGAGLLGLAWVVIDYLNNRGTSTAQWVVFGVCSSAILLAEWARASFPR